MNGTSNTKLAQFAQAYSRFLHGRGWILLLVSLAICFVFAPRAFMFVFAAAFVALSIDAALATAVFAAKRDSRAVIWRGLVTLVFGCIAGMCIIAALRR